MPSRRRRTSAHKNGLCGTCSKFSPAQEVIHVTTTSGTDFLKMTPSLIQHLRWHASFPSLSELILHDASVKNLAVYMSSQAVNAWIALLVHLCTRSQCVLQCIGLEWRVETKYEARVQLDGSLGGLVQNLIMMFPDVFTDHHTSYFYSIDGPQKTTRYKRQCSIYEHLHARAS